MIHIQKENAYTISYHEFFIKKNNNVFAIFGDFLHDFYIIFHNYMTGVLPTPPSLLTVPWSRTLTTTAVNSRCVTTRLRLLLFLPQSPPVLYQDSLLQLQTSSPPQLPTLMVNSHVVLLAFLLKYLSKVISIAWFSRTCTSHFVNQCVNYSMKDS